MSGRLPPEHALAAGIVLTSSGGRSSYCFAALDFRRISGKGHGAFAQHDIRHGMPILSEAALASIVVPDRNKVSGEQMVLQLQSAIDGLDDVQSAAYFSLMQLPDGDPAGLPLSFEAAAGIWMTNAHPTSQASDSSARGSGAADGQAVFEQISRINHACHPNTCLSWDGAAGRKICCAARDIERG